MSSVADQLQPTPGLPLGTATFLFTDVEGSTRLARTLGDGWPEVMADHQRLLRESFWGGVEVDTEGDAFFVAFGRAKDAVLAAIEAQRRITAHVWPSDGRVAVRMGVHTGEAQVVEGRYRGVAVHHAARIGAAAHGGQIVISESTRHVLEDDPIPDMHLRDLGLYNLKDIEQPEHLFQVAVEGMPLEFPPLRADRPPKPWWQRRRVQTAAALAAALVATAAAIASTFGSAPAGAIRLAANSVALIDAKTGKATGDVRLPFTPGTVTTDGRSAWVIDSSSHTATRIDLSTRRVLQVAGFRGAPSSGWGGEWAGGGTDWIAVAGAVAMLPPDAAEATQITLWRPSGGLSYDCPAVVSGGGGAIWVSQGRHLAELDRSGDVRNRWALPPAPPPAGRFGTCYTVAFGAGNLFAARWPDGTVGRIAVTSDTYAPLVRIPGGYQSLQDVGIGFDSIWIATRETEVQPGTLRTVVRGMVTQYAAVSGQEFVKTAIGRDADALAVDPASGVWAVDRPGEIVTRIDPITGRATQEISLRHFAYGIAAASGTVVVSVQSP